MRRGDRWHAYHQDQLGGIWEIIFRMTLPQPLSTVLKKGLRPGPLPIAPGGPGAFAQFTPRRSLVRSQYRPAGRKQPGWMARLDHLSLRARLGVFTWPRRGPHPG